MRGQEKARRETYNMEFSNTCVMRMRGELAHRSAFVCICGDDLEIGVRFLKRAGINLLTNNEFCKKNMNSENGFPFFTRNGNEMQIRLQAHCCDGLVSQIVANKFGGAAKD